ncbi:MAG: hypothetical protein ACK5LP_06095 [Campylobacteraceae bacterium]
MSELKFQLKSGYRLYFHIYIKDKEMIILNAGNKKTQSRDIEKAILILEEIKKVKK